MPGISRLCVVRFAALPKYRRAFGSSVMNTIMVHVWNEQKWQHVVPDVIDCLRSIMQQPALAESQLTEIEQKLSKAPLAQTSERLPAR